MLFLDGPSNVTLLPAMSAFSMSLWHRFHPSQVRPRWREVAISALAAGLAIGLNAWLSRWVLPGEYLVYLAASMGASTILVFAVHHSPLSQPWAVIGGHLAGAASGLFAASLGLAPIPALMVAMVLTVVLQLGLRCLHAPGGGTALLPLLGGAAIQAEGWGFIGVVLLNTGVLTSLGLVINNLIPGRSYPQTFTPTPPQPHPFTEAELEAALREMDSFVDITPQDLEQLYLILNRHSKS
jgi:CBS-domain-containing membrane protein